MIDRILKAVLARVVGLISRSGEPDYPSAPSGLTLYHAGGSPYSQMVRLVLAEKGVAWTSRTFAQDEQSEPWYAKLNPEMKVPALKHGERVVCDSARIVRYIDRTFEGIPLSPDDPVELAAMERWIDLEAALPLREYQYGSAKGPLRRSLLDGFEEGCKRLEQRRADNPELAAVYAAKLADLEALCAHVTDPEAIAALGARVDEALDRLECHCRGHEWLAGDRYSLADAVWTGFLARLAMLGGDVRWRRGRRPAVEAWWRRMVARPSFREADVWDRLRPRPVDLVARPLFRWLFRCAEADARS